VLLQSLGGLNPITPQALQPMERRNCDTESRMLLHSALRSKRRAIIQHSTGMLYFPGHSLVIIIAIVIILIGFGGFLFLLIEKVQNTNDSFA